MAHRTKKGLVAALFAWLFLIGVAALSYRYIIAPIIEADKESEAEAALIESTSANRSFTTEVVLHADAFTGYAVLRSLEFQQALADEGIRLTIVDDSADYTARMAALESGAAQMAAFPVNSFLRAGDRLGKFPATIVLIIDETQGADAIVAFKQGLDTVQALNDPKGRVVFTPDSPSEFLAEITVESFLLPNLSDDWRVTRPGSEAIYREMLQADKSVPTAYVLWEPEVSKALENPDIHVLLDSSKTKGYILDALVVERSFLKENQAIVNTVVKAYLRTVYQQASKGTWAELVMADMALAETSLTEKHATSIAKGIQWKNTTDNMNYFGLGVPSNGAETMDTIISKIVKVMQQTNLLAEDPLNGSYTSIYFDRILKDLQSEKFHPAKQINIISGAQNIEVEQASLAVELSSLSEAQWAQLNPVGNFQIDQVRFPRMSDRVTPENQRKLEALAQRLKDWPTYYITIIGQSQETADSEVNELALDLANRRASAAAEILRQNGVSAARLRTQAQLSTAAGWSALNLLFEAGQLPF